MNAAQHLTVLADALSVLASLALLTVVVFMLRDLIRERKRDERDDS